MASRVGGERGAQRRIRGGTLAWGGGAALLVLSGLGGVLAGVVPAGANVAAELYAAPSGSTSGGCTTSATPCTLQHAITVAKSKSGTVVVAMAAGTYGQTTVTIAGPGPTTLVLQGTTGTDFAPSSLASNVTEGRNGAFFNDNTGAVDAIIGVDAPSTNVTVEDVAVTGKALSSGAKIAGVAYVDTSGTIASDTFSHIEVTSAVGDSSDHAVDVNNVSGATTATVQVSHDTFSTLAGHVDVDLMGGAHGLDATVTGSTMSGTPVTTTSPDVAQFGVAAAGLTGLTVSGNTIQGFASPWDVGAVWVDPLAPGATCTISGNKLLNDDDGVDLRGGSRCTVSGNTITAGAAGVEVGPSPNTSATPTTPSNNDVIAGNTITGTATVATTKSYAPSTSAPTVDQVPVDGVLVWDGSHTAVTGNTVSGFANDVYVGEDPAYIYNKATWGGSITPPMSTFTTATTTVTNNRLTSPVAPTDGTPDYGLAHANDPTAYTLTAQGNWWGTASGPSSAGSGTGSPVSTTVDFANWCTTATPCPSAPSAPQSVTATAGDTGSGQAQVGWKAPATDGGKVVTSYTVVPHDLTSGTTGAGQTFPATASQPVTVTNLAQGHSYDFTVVATNPVGPGAASAASNAIIPTASSPSTPTMGYTLAGADGGVFAFGNNEFYGSMGGQPLDQRVVGVADAPTGKGYWEVARDGGIFAFGTAPFEGSVPGDHITVDDIVGIAAAPTGQGYWVVGSDGSVYAFGSAKDESSLPKEGVTVSDIVGIVAGPTDGGYWLVGSDGGIFAFGSATYEGSLPADGVHVTDIVGITAAPTGNGYWLVGADGGIFAFGSATFQGSLPGVHVTVDDIVGIAPAPTGKGYWLVGSDGGVFAFGTAGFEGSMGGQTLDAPVVGLTL